MYYIVAAGNYRLTYVNGNAWNNLSSWEWSTNKTPYMLGYDQAIDAIKSMRKFIRNVNLPDDAAEHYASIAPFEDVPTSNIANTVMVETRNWTAGMNYAKIVGVS